MEIQIAYKFTEEKDKEGLKNFLSNVAGILEKSGHNVYCPALDSELPKNERSILIKSLNKLKQMDVLLALINSKEKSVGMLAEIGCALGHNKKVVIAIKNDIDNSRLKHLTDNIIEFNDVDELYDKLGRLNI